MKVIVYEDDQYCKKILEEFLVKIPFQLGLNIDILFEDDLSTIIKLNQSDEIIVNILDIIYKDDKQNEKMSGLDVAKKIREYNRNSYVIFYTNHMEYIEPSVNSHIEPHGYIYKGHPNAFDMLKACFNKILKDIRSYQDIKQKIVKFIDVDNEVLYEDVSKIHFITTKKGRQRILSVFTDEYIYEIKGNLNQVLEELQEYFVQTHKSVIVNKHKIKKIKQFEKGYRLYYISTGINKAEIEQKCLYSKNYDIRVN